MERNILSYDTFFLYCLNVCMVYKKEGGYYFREKELKKLLVDIEGIVYIPCIDSKYGTSKVWIEK